MDKKQNHSTARTERKWHWSVIDTVILLLVLLAIGGVVYRVIAAVRREDSSTPNKLYDVYFAVDSIHENVLAEIECFDAVYLYENDIKLGYIGAYRNRETGETRPALDVSAGANPAGANMVAIQQGYMVCSAGTMTNGSLMIGEAGCYLSRGSVLEIRTDRVLMTIRILDIREQS